MRLHFFIFHEKEEELREKEDELGFWLISQENLCTEIEEYRSIEFRHRNREESTAFIKYCTGCINVHRFRGSTACEFAVRLHLLQHSFRGIKQHLFGIDFDAVRPALNCWHANRDSTAALNCWYGNRDSVRSALNRHRN